MQPRDNITRKSVKISEMMQGNQTKEKTDSILDTIILMQSFNDCIQRITRFNGTTYWHNYLWHFECSLNISFLDDYFKQLCNNARSLVQGGRTNLRCMAYRALRWVWTFNCGQLPDNASPTPTFNTSPITDLDMKYLKQQNTRCYCCEGYDG